MSAPSQSQEAVSIGLAAREPHRAAATPADVVRGFYAALKRGDVPGVLGLLSDEVEWTEAERFPYFSGTWHSPTEVLEKLFAPLARDWDGFSAEAHEFISEGDRVIALGVYSGTFKATGREMTASFAHSWTVRDGRIVRFDMYADTAKVLEAMKP